MEMTNKEIVRRYLDADRKKPQIEILADLNGTDISTIKGILIAEGVMKKSGPKGPRKMTAAAPEAMTADNANLSPVLLDAAHLGIEYLNMQIREIQRRTLKLSRLLRTLRSRDLKCLRRFTSFTPTMTGTSGTTEMMERL